MQTIKSLAPLHAKYLGSPELFHPTWVMAFWYFLTEVIKPEWTWEAGHFDMIKIAFGYGEKKGRQWRALILSPRNVGKTSVLVYALSIWLAIKYRNDRIILSSESGKQLRIRFDGIKKIVENNNMLRVLFPDFSIARSVEERLFFTGNTSTEGEGNLIGVSVGASKTSVHGEWAIADDWVGYETSKTQYQRDELHNWRVNTFEGMVVEAKGIFIIGTRHKKDDEYGRLLGLDNNGQPLLVRDIVSRKVKANIASNIDSWSPEQTKAGYRMYPLRFDPKKCEELKTAVMGTTAYAVQMCQNPDIQEGTMCEYKFIQTACDKWQIGFIPNVVCKMLSIDLAVKKGSHNDYTALVVGGLSVNGEAIIFESISRRLSLAELADCIKTLQATHDIKLIGYEDVAAQEFAGQYLKEALKGLIHEDLIVGCKKTMDKVAAYSGGLLPLLETGKVFLNPDKCKGLVKQLADMTWEGEIEHDDEIDAANQLVNYLRENKPPDWRDLDEQKFAPLNKNMLKAIRQANKSMIDEGLQPIDLSGIF